MATKYQMQAATPDGYLVTWLSVAPDWLAANAPTLFDGEYSDIAVAGGGIETSTSSGGGGGGSLTDDSGATITDDAGATITDG